MRRGIFCFAFVLALRRSCAQADCRTLRRDTTTVEPDQTETDDALSPGIGQRRRAGTREGPVLATTKQSVSASDREELTSVLQSEDVADARDYLNALVEESVSTDDPQLSNLAFFKTHKTGSTTLSSIFYRYGIRHDLKVAYYPRKHMVALPIEEAFPMILEECDGRVDIMHLHIGTSTEFHMPWREAAEHFKTIMRDPDHINFVTLFREPRSHFLSYYYFFLFTPLGHKPVEEFLLETHGADDRHWDELHNPSAGELGITTRQQLEDFVENDLPNFKLVMLTDRFDEGLMVLRNLFGWRLIDMSYEVLNQTSETNKVTRKSPNGRGTAKDHIPTFDELSLQAQNKIDELTSLDRALYEAGQAHYQKKLAPLAPQVEADLADFDSVQQLVHQYLESNSTSGANRMYSSSRFPPVSSF